MKRDGFTLIEIIIALAIFAILSVISFMMLHNAIRNYQHLKNTLARWQQISRAASLIRMELSQIVDRHIMTGQDGVEASVTTYDHHGIAFTRMGFDHLQRVAYVLKQHQLFRLTWSVLDRWPQSPIQKKILLNHVQAMSIQYLDNHHQFVTTWPYALGSNAQALNEQSDLPTAISITLKLENLGKINWLVSIPAQGNTNEK